MQYTSTSPRSMLQKANLFLPIKFILYNNPAHKFDTVCTLIVNQSQALTNEEDDANGPYCNTVSLNCNYYGGLVAQW